MKKLLFYLQFMLFFYNVHADYCWIQKSSINAFDRYAAYGFSINGKGYVCMGWYNGSALSDNWEYDPVIDAWSQKANLPAQGRWAGAHFSINGKGYITVGCNTSAYPVATYEYDPVLNTWNQKADFPFQIQDCNSFTIGNFGYVVGGYYASSYSNALHQYNPVTDTWTQMANFPGGDHESTRSFVIGNIAYLVGGYAQGSATNWHFAYNSNTNSWSTRAPMPGSSRHSCSTFEMNGKGFAGNGRMNGITYLNDFYEYDPVTDSWTPIPDFPGQTLGYTTGFTLGSNGYIATGKFNSSTNSNETWMLGYKPEAIFTAVTDSCGLTASFTNLSNYGTTYNWNFGDGTSISNSTQMNLVHTYLSPGTYTVVLIASNGFCSDTTTQQINIVGNLNATFGIDLNDCTKTVTINAFSTNASATIWNWGDGQQTVGAPVPHTYANTGNYIISLTLINGNCTHVLTYPVTIIPQAVSSFSVSTGCNLSVTITNNSINTNSYSWNWGNGETATGLQTGYTYDEPGTYTITLIVSDTVCFDTSSVIVTVVEETNYQISVQNDSCSNEIVMSVYPDPGSNVNWDFADGTTASGNPVSHNYLTESEYEVIAIVNPGSACPDTAIITITPEEIAYGELFIPNVFTPNNDSRNDFFEINAGASYCNFEEIEIFNRWGMLIYESNDPKFKWDGKSNGTDCPEGVFVYIIKSTSNYHTGCISLLR